jgi:hypothetical protein
MTTVRFEKTTSGPVSPFIPGKISFVQDISDPTEMVVHVGNLTGTGTKHSITRASVLGLINSAVSPLNTKALTLPTSTSAVVTDVVYSMQSGVEMALPISAIISLVKTQNIITQTISVNTTAVPFTHYIIKAPLTLTLPAVALLTKDDIIRFTNMSGSTTGVLLNFSDAKVKGQTPGLVTVNRLNESQTVQWSADLTVGWVG